MVNCSQSGPSGRRADTWESLTTGDALQLIADYRDAIAAAETYHEAWQDAAVYWKERLKQAEEEARRCWEAWQEAGRE